MSPILEDLCKFLDQSPTSWHAVEEVASRLKHTIPLEEGEKWKLQKNKRYFVKRGGSICAFALPEKAPSKMTIVAAHTDSPALKIKPNPEVLAGSMHLLETELYGGPLLSSWFNRDLAIAGRIVFEHKGKLQEKLVFFTENPLFIPQLAIHLDREVNEKGFMIDKQDHLRPIFSLAGGKKNLLEPLLKKQVPSKDILSFDLFLVPIEKSRYLGMSDEMLASYRLDNLTSSHACVTAWNAAPSNDSLQIMLLCDAEEIGSRTVDGAASTFMEDVLKRIRAFYNLTQEDYICMKTESLCLSVDVAHAFSPNHPKKFDPQHQLIPGEGIVIKYNADKKHVTDARTAAPIVAACRKAKLSYQSFASHSNYASGSTIGPIFAHTMGIPTADIGCAIFSMHSTREVMAVQDHLDMCQLLTALLKR